MTTIRSAPLFGPCSKALNPTLLKGVCLLLSIINRKSLWINASAKLHVMLFECSHEGDIPLSDGDPHQYISCVMISVVVAEQGLVLFSFALASICLCLQIAFDPLVEDWASVRKVFPFPEYNDNTAYLNQSTPLV